MEYHFYGHEWAEAKPVSSAYPGIDSPTALFEALSELWCAETCTPRLRAGWTEQNKTLGQCSITAFLVQDIFGGRVYGISTGFGTHCFNVVGGLEFDLTSEQFGGKKLDYTACTEQSREAHFAVEEKRLRYELLKKKLSEYCSQKLSKNT